MDSQHEIRFGTKTIRFQLSRADRKSLGIKVMPDMTVCVIAPAGAEESEILKKVQTKAAWITRQQNHFESFHPLTPPRKFVPGETHLYLGRQYRLKIQKAGKEAVKLQGGHITLFSPSTDRIALSILLDQWYRERAEFHFNSILNDTIPRFRKYDIPEPRLQIRKMDKRWGSCSPSARICLNLELIKAPKGSIEYVVVHELCHLVHRDHTQKFYALQDRMMGDWRKWKERLERGLV